MKHAIRTQADTFHHRRRFPKDVAQVLGKGEFKRLLGNTERQALRNFPKVNAEFERLVTQARQPSAGSSRPLTTLEIHRLAEIRSAELANMVVHVGGNALPGSDPDAADIIPESIMSAFPEDRETGEPVGMLEVEARALAILSSGGKLARPAPTIEDAARLYSKDRIEDDINENAKQSRLKRALAFRVTYPEE